MSEDEGVGLAYEDLEEATTFEPSYTKIQDRALHWYYTPARIERAYFADVLGQDQRNRTSLILELLREDGARDVKKYSCGSKNRVNHTTDGKRLTAKAWRKSTFGLFIARLMSLGVDRRLFASGDISALEGLRFYWTPTRIERPKPFPTSTPLFPEAWWTEDD